MSFGINVLDSSGNTSLPVTSESFVFLKTVTTDRFNKINLGINDNTFTPIIFSKYFRSYAEDAGDGGFTLTWSGTDWQISTPYCQLQCYIFVPAKYVNRKNPQKWGIIIYNDKGEEMLISGTRPLIMYYDKTVNDKLPFPNCACSSSFLGLESRPIGSGSIWGLFLHTATVRDSYIRDIRYVVSTSPGGTNPITPEYIPYINIDDYV